MSPVTPATGLRCRQIKETDLDAIITLCRKGFPERSEEYWRLGLARHVARALPAGYPVYGFLLEVDGRAVGVLLTLHSTRVVAGREIVCCNNSTWYVEPAFRSHSILLEKVATRRPDVVYLDLTPAPHTQPIIETRGFVRFCAGQMLSVPLLNRGRRDATVRIATLDDPLPELSSHDRILLRDHLGYGCVALVCTDLKGTVPLIFQRRSVNVLRNFKDRVRVSCLQLIYSHDAGDIARFAGAVGRRLLVSERTVLVVIDATGPLPGLWGRYFPGRAPKYVRGAATWPIGDLAYTELVLFGP